MWRKTEHNTKQNQASGTTLISSTTMMKGNVIFEGTMHIEGKVQGNISSEGVLLTLSPGGCVEGDICVPSIQINGQVIGNVYCSGNLKLAEKAVITGSVYYNIIEIAKGAEVNQMEVHGRLESTGNMEVLPAANQQCSDPGAC